MVCMGDSCWRLPLELGKQLGLDEYRMRNADAIGKHWHLLFVAYFFSPRLLLAVLVKRLNRPTEQISGDNFLGVPTKAVGDKDNIVALTRGIVEANDQPDFA
jgi:hypothetical protein